jgi:hypothetical protein
MLGHKNMDCKTANMRGRVRNHGRPCFCLEKMHCEALGILLLRVFAIKIVDKITW